MSHYQELIEWQKETDSILGNIHVKMLAGDAFWQLVTLSFNLKPFQCTGIFNVQAKDIFSLDTFTFFSTMLPYRQYHYNLNHGSTW